MEMKSRFVQLCIDVSTWSMVTILRVRQIQVKEKIVRIMIGREGRRNVAQRTYMQRSCAQY